MQVAKWLQSQVIGVTPAKGCSYFSFHDMWIILHFLILIFPSFCRVLKRFTMSQVEFMPMRLKPTPPSQHIRGFSLWPVTMAGNFSCIACHWSMPEFRAQFSFSHCVSKFWNPYGGNVYNYFYIKKGCMRICSIEWTNFICILLTLWDSGYSFVTEDCKLKYSLPQCTHVGQMASKWPG